MIPRAFLISKKKNFILDEVQEYPEILSYVQIYTDQEEFNCKIILTGSNSLLINERVSQSLAGRTRIFYILPLSYLEIPVKIRPKTIDEVLLKGLYPRIYWQNLDPTEWIADYIQTYVQKDVRQVVQIEKLMIFDKLLRLLAGRAGQILNYSSLANDVGVSIPTIKNWISILEASFVVFTIAPHFKNFNKRITKSPKIYFYDTAILCFLLRITHHDQLETHPLRGNIFENFIVTEKIKSCFNHGIPSPYYFWRDQHGHEVDLVEDRGTYLYCIEIKSSSTFHEDYLKNIKWINNLQSYQSGEVIYGGEEDFIFQKYKVKSWKKIGLPENENKNK